MTPLFVLLAVLCGIALSPLALAWCRPATLVAIQQLRPGDLLVVSYPNKLSPPQLEAVEARVRAKTAPGVGVLVLDDGVSLSAYGGGV